MYTTIKFVADMPCMYWECYLCFTTSPCTAFLGHIHTSTYMWPRAAPAPPPAGLGSCRCVSRTKIGLRLSFPST